MTSAASPISAAAKQQHQYDNNQDQIHGKSPLMVTALLTARRVVQSADRVLNLTHTRDPPNLKRQV
jgi:hypothetical protein